MAAHGNCYALLLRQSACAFSNASGRSLVNFRDGSLVPCFSAPGNHGYWEKHDLALLIAQGATATDIVFIDYPVHTQFDCEQVAHNEPHSLQFADLVWPHQLRI